jgi:hypothetical protein
MNPSVVCVPRLFLSATVQSKESVTLYRESLAKVGRGNSQAHGYLHNVWLLGACTFNKLQSKQFG